MSIDIKNESDLKQELFSYETKELRSKDGKAAFDLVFEKTKCLTPDDITIAQAEFVAEILKTKNSPHLIELGIGSGVFPTTVMLNMLDSSLKFTGFDINSNALNIANRNLQSMYEKFKLSNSTFNLHRSNWLHGYSPEIIGKADMIYANPPYLEEGLSVRPEFQGNPNHALYAKDGGMEHFPTIIMQSFQFLKPDGTLFLRTWNEEAQISRVESLVKELIPHSHIERKLTLIGGRKGAGLLISLVTVEI